MMNRKSIAIFACCILLLALIATGVDDDDQNQKVCTYTVQIKTAAEEEGVKNPATTDPVDVKFGDGTPEPITIQNINSKFLDEKNDSKPFQAGATDSFKFTDRCLESKICSLYVKLNGEDDWKVDTAKVDVNEDEDLSSHWIEINREVTLKKWDGAEDCLNKTDTNDLDEVFSRSITKNIAYKPPH